MNLKYKDIIEPYLNDGIPHIFYVDSSTTNVEQYYFNKCLYGYYQITLGSDGYVYKCSASATPSAKQCRLGTITSDVDKFNKMIIDNYNPEWDCKKMCFDNGIRCNRMGIDINQRYYKDYD